MVLDLATSRPDARARDSGQFAPASFARSLRASPRNGASESRVARSPQAASARDAVSRGCSRRGVQTPRSEDPAAWPRMGCVDDGRRIQTAGEGQRTIDAESDPPTPAAATTLSAPMPRLPSASHRAPTRPKVAVPSLRRGRATGPTRHRQHSWRGRCGSVIARQPPWGHNCRKAVATGIRAARTAGKIPPIRPSTSETAMPAIIKPGVT